MKIRINTTVDVANNHAKAIAASCQRIADTRHATVELCLMSGLLDVFVPKAS